ncbi:MAG: chromosome segregation protein SMC [Prosthecochloris sp.]|nr:chromosome segregation protein SMC [Prosthecochloris sp.]
MYLSKIELFGFKSFAHRVKITFDKGLTAIVGPNGCGKTNVVDAIRWVLGEQKSALLRSTKMENIIFNGTRSLKPLSLSEVSLTIQNTRNVLPVEYTEVTITRRLYRNGESEYLLNQVPCRLRDILDLFADTGMGSDAYSVIELKMIEEIISNKSEERLRLLEEAAGITRYKQRRKQTFRQLDSTSRDLERVDDLLSEVAKKTRSLKTQVRKAETCRELKQNLRTLELSLGLVRLEEYEQRLEPLKQKRAAEESRNEELATRLTLLDSQLQEDELKQLNLEQELAERQKQLNALSEQLHSGEKRLVELNEQTKRLEERVTRAEHSIMAHRDTAASLQKEQEELKKAADPLLQKHKDEEERLQRLRDEQQKAGAILADNRNNIRALQRSLDEHERQLSSLRISRQKEQTTCEHLQKRLRSLDEAMNEHDQRLENLAGELQELTEKRDAVQQHLHRATEEISGLRALKEQIAEQIESGRERLFEQRSRKERLQNSILLADSILDSYEGLPEGIEFLENEAATKSGLGCLSDVISLDPEYRKAVNAALGEALGYYLCATFEEAHGNICRLMDADKGKLSFLVLEHLPSPSPAEQTCIDGSRPALSVVECPEPLSRALSLLLHNTHISADFETARRLSHKHPQYTFVTMEGEKITPSGIVHGGSTRENEGLRLGKKAERDRLMQQKEELDALIAQQDSALQDLGRKHASIPLKDKERQHNSLERELNGLERGLTALETRQSSGAKERERAREERRRTEEEYRQSMQAAAALAPDINRLEEERDKLLEELKQVRENNRRAEEAHNQRNRDVQNRENRFRELRLELDKLRFRQTGCSENILKAEAQVKDLQQEISTAESLLEETRRDIAACSSRLDEQRIQSGQRQETINGLETGYREIKIRNQQTRNDLRDIRRSHDTGVQLATELREQQRTIEKNIDALLTSVQTRYDCNLHVIDHDVPEGFDPQQAEADIEIIRSRLQKFGAVNELALEEYQQEKERFDFLNEQKDDLLSAERQLRATIDEINKTALKKFDDTYQSVRSNFISIFRELFEETDEADLKITTEDDPLEAHISIIAKPRGKKPLSIEQLSGGEKALTALSLLFSIYLVKPSPFCILDEVDAPLDDSNIGRFIKLLKKFENNTQFIIVTHNKKTMASSQALYGVTMEEEGVSKLIPVRLEKQRT